MSPDIKVILAILAGLTASALARFSNGPSAADTYTGGFLYWLGYSGFDFGVIAAGIVWLVMWGSPNRASVAATSLLSVTILAAVLGVFRQVTSDVRFIPTADMCGAKANVR
jgi:hypothetical protein